MNSVVSLFCGCGGVDLGTLGGFNFNKRKYEPHPCKLVYACDIDQKAVDSHKLNFGGLLMMIAVFVYIVFINPRYMNRKLTK